VNLSAFNDKATQCDTNFTPAFASTPRKKATIEELNETVSTVNDSAANFDEQDVTYDPDNSKEDDDTDREHESEQRISPQAERKFIVFESCLLSLFNVCVLCLATTHAMISKVIGTCCIVRQKYSLHSYFILLYRYVIVILLISSLVQTTTKP
jgi:hypothetical protein